MFSITLRRSAATLGVVLAGLLAAAGPASAQMVDGPVLASASCCTGEHIKGVRAPQAMHLEQISMGVQAPRANGSEVAMESVTQARSLNDVEVVDFNALGTQIGALGIVKSFDSDKGSGFIERTGGPDVFVHSSARTSGLQDCLVSGYNAKAAEGTQVGSEGVKAPSKADNQSKHELEDCMVSGFTFGQGAIPLL